MHLSKSSLTEEVKLCRVTEVNQAAATNVTSRREEEINHRGTETPSEENREARSQESTRLQYAVCLCKGFRRSYN